MEQSVLDALAKGYSYKETADLLGISYSTVHTHIERIYQKLHVQSRGQGGGEVPRGLKPGRSFRFPIPSRQALEPIGSFADCRALGKWFSLPKH